MRTKLKELEADVRDQEAALNVSAIVPRPVKVPSLEDILYKAKRLEETLAGDPTVAREMMIGLFDDGGLILEPQVEGHYLARSQLFPLKALTANATAPRPGGSGRRATPLGCAGAIEELDHVFSEPLVFAMVA